MIKRIFSQTWEVFFSNLSLLVLQTILMEVIYFLLYKFTIIGGEILRCFFIAGMYNVIFKKEKKEFDDLFIGFKNKFLAKNILLYEIIVILGSILGGILLIIPGLYFFISTIFALPIIVKEKIDVISAIKLSMKFFNKNIPISLLAILFIIIINGIAIFPYGLLSIFTVPFSICLIGKLWEVLSS